MLQCTDSLVGVLGLGSCDMRKTRVPQPGTEPMSPALQGGFLTTGPPGKSLAHFLIHLLNVFFEPPLKLDNALILPSWGLGETEDK